MGKDAEWKVAVCCDSWLDNTNVSERTKLNAVAASTLRRPSLLFHVRRRDDSRNIFTVAKAEYAKLRFVFI